MPYHTIKNRPHVRAYRIWNNARQRAKKNNLEFTITKKWIQDCLEKGVCQVTGVPFVLEVSEGSGRGNPWGPSLDRLDPSQGYTPKNSQMVIWMYNNAKGYSASHDQIVDFARALLASQGEIHDAVESPEST